MGMQMLEYNDLDYFKLKNKNDKKYLIEAKVENLSALEFLGASDSQSKRLQLAVVP